MILKRKDILGLKDIDKTEIEAILSTADLMKYILKQGNKKTPHLQGKSVVTLRPIFLPLLVAWPRENPY
jgi:aspartate carbamoyltransferase catalytic subunit